MKKISLILFIIINELIIFMKSQYLVNIFDETDVNISEVMNLFYSKPYFSQNNGTISNIQSYIDLKGNNPIISNTTFISNNFLIRDLSFTKNGELLKEAKDYTLDLDINQNDYVMKFNNQFFVKRVISAYKYDCIKHSGDDRSYHHERTC